MKNMELNVSKRHVEKINHKKSTIGSEPGGIYIIV
jgi:hypothetical protein